MNHDELKDTENNINAIQAKLGLLRAEAKRHKGTIKYTEIQNDIADLESQVDQLQAKYIKTKREVNNG